MNINKFFNRSFEDKIINADNKRQIKLVTNGQIINLEDEEIEQGAKN